VYLKDHSRDYEKAANVIRDKRLASYLLTYQSWVWNHILAHYLQQNNVVTSSVGIAGRRLPLLDLRQHRDELQGLMIELPRLTAYYQGNVATAAEAALADEELTLQDFNIRLIRRVCFAKGERAAWFAPTDVRIGEPVAGQHKPEAWSVTVSFALPVQHYATVVLKAASVYMGASLND
jgi:tRNA(Glu) U13 pseudouridine synthase TruD